MKRPDSANSKASGLQRKRTQKEKDMLKVKELVNFGDELLGYSKTYKKAELGESEKTESDVERVSSRKARRPTELRPSESRKGGRLNSAQSGR